MRLFSYLRGAMTMIMALAVISVSCQKEPEVTNNNIVVYADAHEAKPEGGSLRFNYSINNPIEGVALDVKCDADWVTINVVTASFVDLTVAIEVGVVLAIVLFVRRVMQTSTISVLEGNEVAATEDVEKASMEDTDRLAIPAGVEVYEIDGPFFFGLASRFEEFESRKGGNTKVRIIRMRKVPFIDSTGVNNLRNLCERTRKRGVTVILSGVTEKVNASLVKFGVDQEIGSENIFPHIVPALERATELASK